MTIREAKNKIRHLENLLDYWEERKAILFEKTQPKAVQIKGEMVQGGPAHDNKMDAYVIEIEEAECNIQSTNKELIATMRYVDNELKRLEEYDPIAQKIIDLRDNQRMAWWKISLATNYSERHCRRIYFKYKKRPIN